MRRPISPRKAKRRFENRADKTHPLNRVKPRRGGIRL